MERTGLPPMRLRSEARCSALAIASILVLVSASEAQTTSFGAVAPAADASAAASKAQSFVYDVDTGVAESDNVTLVSSDKVSQTMAVVDGDFDIRQRSRLLDLDAKGDFTYLDYLQGAYGGQLIGRFDGSAHLALIPDRVIWVVQDDFGQAALDPFTPVTPNNLENVNYVSTGPDFALRFGASSYLNASARYANVQYETSPYNSNRLLGDLAWGYQLSAQSSVSLNGDTERVMFQNTALNSDFDRSSGFVRYEVQGARTNLSVDLGATTINQNAGSIAVNQNGTLTTINQNHGATTGSLAKLELSRKLSSAAKLTLSLGRELTDASTSFSNLQGGAIGTIGTIGTAPAAQTADNYTSQYASARWQYQRNRTTIAVSGRWEKDEYDGIPALDNTRSGGEFSVARRLTRALTAELLGRYYKTDYVNGIVAAENGSTNYDDEMIGAALTWRHGRGLEIKLRCEHSARVTAGIYGYGENRAMLTVGYRPKGRESESDPGALSPGT
jgi:hypothetical protein